MTTAVATPLLREIATSEAKIWLRCPECGQSAGPISDRDDGSACAWIRCKDCDNVIRKRGGIWRTLSGEQRAHFAGFIEDYETIRRREGRGSDHPAFYLALPYADLTGNFREQWDIRGRSYRFIERHLLPQLEARHGADFRALDVGAGNGWLSYRLALLGHRPVAIDLCCNAWDGLRAAEHFGSVLPELFPRFEAGMNELPFEDAQFDVVIFNASFHYSTNYNRTLREALRCLRPGGTILIVDSPTYRHAHSGEAMRLERRIHFEVSFGTRGDALPTGDFLTTDVLDTLGQLGIRWKRHLAWYGIRWWLRPWIARIKGRREPSQFYLYEGQTEKQ